MSVRPLGARSVARMRERDTRIAVVPASKAPEGGGGGGGSSDSGSSSGSGSSIGGR